MSRKKSSQKEERICCIAYLATEGELFSVETREKKQLSYIQGYADAHSIKIVRIMHRDIVGQADINHHFDKMVAMIQCGKVDGIILANMMSVSSGLADAYHKIGKVKAAGGHIVTVDEGRLGLNIKAVIS